jgi:hypothetical protein
MEYLTVAYIHFTLIDGGIGSRVWGWVLVHPFAAATATGIIVTRPPFLIDLLLTLLDNLQEVAYSVTQSLYTGCKLRRLPVSVACNLGKLHSSVHYCREAVEEVHGEEGVLNGGRKKT